MKVYIVLKEVGSYSDYSCSNIKAFAYKEDAEAFVDLNTKISDKIGEWQKEINAHRNKFRIANPPKQNIPYKKKPPFAKVAISLEDYKKIIKEIDEDNNSIKIQNDLALAENKKMDNILEGEIKEMTRNFLLSNNLPADIEINNFIYSSETSFSYQEMEVDCGILG